MRKSWKIKKHNFFKLVTTSLLGIVIMTGLSTKSYAVPKQMPDGNKFDSVFYATTYPDVAAILGTDETVLYNHYLLCGINEGRLPYDINAEKALKNQTIYNKLMELKEIYPDGTSWDKNTSYIINTNREKFPIGTEVKGCVAFAFMVQDMALGSYEKMNYHNTGLMKWSLDNSEGKWEASEKTDWTFIPIGYTGQDPVVNGNFEEYWDNLQVGDAIRDEGHTVIILTKADDYVTVAESNYRGSVVHWGRKIIKKQILYCNTLKLDFHKKYTNSAPVFT